MKHIKYLKERRNSQDSEFDLRGLGETSAIRAEYPLTHLSVRTKKIEIVNKCLSIFSLESKISKSHQEIVHIFSPRHDLNHKEKTVILIGAALYISHLDGNAQMLMNEINRLAKLIENGSISNAEDDDSNFLEWIKDPKHLSVHPGMQLYLQHAGFALKPSCEVQHFVRESLILLRTRSSEVTAPARPLKAIGE